MIAAYSLIGTRRSEEMFKRLHGRLPKALALHGINLYGSLKPILTDLQRVIQREVPWKKGVLCSLNGM